MKKQLYKTLYKINAWQIRIIALTCLVVLVGSSSQFLANAFAVGIRPEPLVQQMTPVATQVPHSIIYPTTRIAIRRAGINSIGGYTVTRKR